MNLIKGGEGNEGGEEEGRELLSLFVFHLKFLSYKVSKCPFSKQLFFFLKNFIS